MPRPDLDRQRLLRGEAYSSYDDGSPARHQRRRLHPGADQALQGATVGSRVAVTGPADEAFGAARQPLARHRQPGQRPDRARPAHHAARVGPEGNPRRPDWAPAITETDGKPHSLDFTGTPKPVGKFRKAVLVEGEGTRVKKGMTSRRYLGQVYAAQSPSTRATPAPAHPSRSASARSSRAGTRRRRRDRRQPGLLIDPAGWATAPRATPTPGIKGTDTLFFVIDILAAV